MSKTFLSRLPMLEVLDAAGPLTISGLARRVGLDTALVSRTVAACEGDGWLTRTGGKIAGAPRPGIHADRALSASAGVRSDALLYGRTDGGSAALNRS